MLESPNSEISSIVVEGEEPWLLIRGKMNFLVRKKMSMVYLVQQTESHKIILWE